MNLKVNYFENKIAFNNDYINVIEIENKKYFYRFVNDIYNIEKIGYSDELAFFDKDNNEINLNGKLKLIVDYFDFGFDSKKSLTDLSKYVTSTIDEEDANLLQNQYNKLIKIYKKILNDIELPLYIDEEINIDLLSKVFKIGINCKNELLDNLFLIIDMEKLFKEKGSLVFINLKQYLYKKELLELYKYSIYNQVKIILIDSQSYGVTLEYEKKLIIDDNLEEIVL